MKIYDTEKAVKVLTYLQTYKEDYGNNISFNLKVTYSYICKILDWLEKAGLIQKIKSGRVKKIVLTPKGREVARRISEIDELMGNEFK